MKKKGGYRPGAGRPTGTSRYKEKTMPIRIPLTLLPEIKERLSQYADLVNFSARTTTFVQLNEPSPINKK